MKTIEYRTVDKSAWPRGPWDSEPDKVQWQDEATGLPCLAVRARGSLGNWCGYVGVSEGHPLFGVGYDQESDALEKALANRREQPVGDHPSFSVLLTCTFGGGLKKTPVDVVSVHGGLTFADFCRPGEEGEGICQVADVGDPDRVWWFGFDCAHCDDLSPGMSDRFGPRHGEYRDLDYIRQECASLAKQLADIKA